MTKRSNRASRTARLPWTPTDKLIVASSVAAGTIAVFLIPWWITVIVLVTTFLGLVAWIVDAKVAQLDPETKGALQVAAGIMVAIACLIGSVFLHSWGDQIKREADAITKDQVAEYRGVYGPDGDWMYKYVHPIERKVHAALKERFRDNPVREIPDDSAQWKATIESNDRLDERFLRKVAREFGLSKRDVDGIWFKLETRKY